MSQLRRESCLAAALADMVGARRNNAWGGGGACHVSDTLLIRVCSYDVTSVKRHVPRIKANERARGKTNLLHGRPEARDRFGCDGEEDLRLHEPARVITSVVCCISVFITRFITLFS